MEDMEKDMETPIEEAVPEKNDISGTEASDEENVNAEASDNEDADAATAENVSRADKKAAKRQAKADKKEDAYKEKIEQLEDRVKRQMAEFENFRKRSDREKQMMFETGAKSVLEKILPVVDNFERGLQTVPPENAEDPFVDGMNRVYKQLLTELDNIGVKPIEAVGCEFDPNLHNAVMQVESDEYESGVVAQELQKGYTYHDSVIRHSMVAVVQ
jgi:molecular chaperone GrpE